MDRVRHVNRNVCEGFFLTTLYYSGWFLLCQEVGYVIFRAGTEEDNINEPV